MKKRIYSFLATLAILCLLSACFPEPPSVVEEEEPPPERKRPLPKSVTLRLADDYDDDVIGITVDNRAAGESRTLTNENAQAFHDIFEAVFYYPGPPVTVARAVWNIGETPELRGVYRTGGIDYVSVSSSPGVTAGSALLFVGSNDDKTLLALGRLTEVDGAATAIITPNSRSVTFTVSALTAGTRFKGQSGSSFSTNYSGVHPAVTPEADDVTDKAIFIHYKDKTKTFPLYRLNRSGDGGTTTTGTYTFNTVSGGTSFSDYANGIVTTGVSNVEVRNPRYIITDGLYQYSSIFVQDTRVTVTTSSSIKPVTFTFNTTNSQDGSIFALVFEIFVYNLTELNDTSAAPTDNNYKPIRWRLSPGIGTKWLDLDDGKGDRGGEGGAILLGSGNVEAWLNNRPPE